ncbi:MAG TPA: ADOP family duplicated permease [Vicinamibacterales bacterium]|nr:ADOP family duplicated permease [Vicinamibacterales bacterium]
MRLLSLPECGREAALAVRFLARRPGFAAVALATLAIGVGGPAAIFSVVNAVLLRPLPYPQPDRLIQFRIEVQGGRTPLAFDALPAETALEWSAAGSTLASLALFNDRALTLSTPDGPYRLSGIAGTPNLFEVLGVQPALGAPFARDPRQIVLSHGMWRRFFAASPAVVGSTVTLDGEPYRVAGVMPPEFGFPNGEAAFWVPMLLEAGGSRGMLLPAVARMRPDATLAAVTEDGTRRLAASGFLREGSVLVVRTMQDLMVGHVRRLLWVLLGAVGLVFVIATTNIALLLLTRGAAREREFSIRAALGAGRSRLVRQLFVEGAVLGVAGGAAGLAFSWLILSTLLQLAPADMPRLDHAAIDTRVVAFAALMTGLTTLVFGMLSAARAAATDPAGALGRATGEPPGVRRRLYVLAAGELALTMVLLVGAGLLLRSFVRALLVDQGFEPGSALAMQINLPASRYPTPAARVDFHERLLDRLAAMPDLDAAGLATAMPNRQPTGRFDYNATGLSDSFDPMTTPVSGVRTISEGFFEAMGVPLLSGRYFTRADGSGAEPVMLISQRLARLHFPDSDPLGRLLYSHSGTRRVVGVVGDVRPAAVWAGTAGDAYLPVRQDQGTFRWFATVTVVARGRDPRSTLSALRALVLDMDPEMPPFNVRFLADEVAGLVAGPRFSATVLAAFGAVALALAAIGIYGVMAHAAGYRTREIGVRLALGATRRQVLRLMLRDGLFVVAAGLGAGFVAAASLARVLTGLLHEVTPADPVALASVAALLASTGMLAAYLPARRATRVSPIEALRNP